MLMTANYSTSTTPRGIYKRGKGYHWQVMIQGQRFSGTARSLTEAQTQRQQIMDTLNATYQDQSITLTQVLDQLLSTDWSPTKSKSHKSFVSLTDGLKHHFYNKPLSEITTNDIDRFALHLQDQGRSPSTINHYLCCLSKAFTWAARRGYLASPPYIPRPKMNNGRTRLLTESEERHLLSYLEVNAPEACDMVVILLDTGIRRGELYSLTRQSVLLHEGKQGQLFLKDTKNGDSRIVPMTQRAADAVKRMMKRNPTSEKLSDKPYCWLWNQWLKARKALGLEEDSEFCLHMLRHTCCTRLVRAGAGIHQIMKFMGHHSITTTTRYTHMYGRDIEPLADLLERRQEKNVVK